MSEQRGAIRVRCRASALAIDFDRSAIASNGGTTTWTNAHADAYSVMGRVSYKFGL